MAIKIEQLFLFPVKSLRGIAVDSAELTDTGFKWDRHWMVIKPDGGFITQRQFTSMVLIQPKMTTDSLILSKQGMDDLIIPLPKASFQQNNDDDKSPAHDDDIIIDAKVWKDKCKVIDEGEQASLWITAAINAPKPLRLVRMAIGHKRPQSKPELFGETTHTLFADAAPLLIGNVNSLEALNTQMKKQNFDAVEMENFRPNIVLNGLAAFEEHSSKGYYNENYELKHCYPCQRCIIPTINTHTGIKNSKQEPFSILADLNAMPDNNKAPAFGENAIVIKGIGSTVNIGDVLKSL